MSIKYKTFLIVILSVLLMIGTTILIFYFSYFGYISKDREEEIKRSFEVVNYIINNEKDDMKSRLVDWGQWNDTYNFIKNQNKEYIDSNLEGNSVKNLGLVGIAFLDNNKKIIYSKESDDEHKSISGTLVDQLLKNSKNFERTSNGNIGLLSWNGKVYITGILSVTPSSESMESDGFLVMIREVDDKLLNYIDQVTKVTLKFEEPSEEKFDASYIYMDDGDIIYNKEDSEAHKLVKDINGDDSIGIKITDMDYGNEHISHFLSNFITQFVSLIVIIIIFDIIIVNKYILKRLLRLTKFIEKVGATKDTSLSVDISGKDEIHKLGNEVNKMLSELNHAHKEILFLSYSDKLTSLRNRAYMEKMFKELDESSDSSYFILMGDLNGLKLTNDALGHAEGDKLLCLVAKILNENCDIDDVISRWGGDEFVILAKNKTRAYVNDLIDRIKEKCESEAEFHFKISIAWGYAGSYEDNLGTESVMSLAEKRMYRNKLMQEKSARSAAINSLLRTLHEKDSETEEHTIRIKNLSVKLGKRIGLPKEKLDELELLSSLHDIGKIGIPEHILMKPSKLTDEEWAIMKTHSDIGYRIATSTPELAHIANNILAHHERYDGTGYPNKLKGEEIPLLSRIINIVDSFDVMSHKRIYKESFHKEYIIEELKRCSGTQFDPFLVKEFINLLEEENIY
ncbi:MULTISPECIES: HD domain-containing phosphohydrolase [unclassified Clostridium]|uniref:HD domain-containing phosphohydrolase n=1 Tax=unclassified Clostridium TaxID=2614128 RepID=UPI0002981EE0|nr:MULTISPECIES: HD domain-containing phosphohydrolase [unclassified Clostridium]EKQ50509.1 MAG: diguanylate cyclase (GGDEF) domain-containing protein [Clostridium sp. Maddingley MBC34-26]